MPGLASGHGFVPKNAECIEPIYSSRNRIYDVMKRGNNALRNGQ